MERNIAAVLQKYHTKENELLTLLGKTEEIEFEALECETPTGVIKLNKKEVKKIFTTNMKKTVTLEEKREKILEVLKYSGRMIQYIDDPDEEMQILAVSNAPYCIQFIKPPTKATKKAYLLHKQYDAPLMGYCRSDDEEFKDFSPEEISQIVCEKPAAMSGVPTEIITEDIVYHFLTGLVKQNLPYLEGAFRNIPNEYKNKFYWQCLCMVQGYNISQMPPEKREEYISEKLIMYCLEHSKSFVSTLWMYEYLPAKFKTKDISILCIMAHFGCIRHLPEELKNEQFIKELAEIAEIEKNNFNWFSDIDINIISKEYFRKMIKTHHITDIPTNTPASYYDEETDIILAANLNNQIPKAVQTEHFYDAMAEQGYIDRIPESKFTEDRCIKLARSKKYRVLSKIPEIFKTKDFMETVITEKLYLKLEDIVDYLTTDIVKEAIRERKVTSFKEIPVVHRSCEMVDLLAEYDNFCIEIPYEYQTEKSCQKLLSKCNRKHYEWFYFLEKCRYRTSDDLNYAVENFKNAIHLPELTREQIDRSIEKYPENILYAPKWYLNKETKESKAEVKQIQRPDDKKVILPENTTFTQLDLFELLGI